MMLFKSGFTANSHHNPFLCSYPEGFGCAAQKVHNRKSSSHVFATKARFSARLSNRADITAGMRASMSPFIYINHFNLIFLYIFLGLWRFNWAVREFRKNVCLPDDSELVSIVEACWSKVMTERQHTLEETCKIEISASHTGETGCVSMTDISPLWEEMAHKAWLLHIGQLSLNEDRRDI